MNEELHKEAERICRLTFDKSNLKFDLEEIRSKKRYAEAVYLRRLVCATLRGSGFSLTEIGRFINRGHCNVIHLLSSDGWAGDAPRSMSDEAVLKQGVFNRIKYHERQIEELRRRLTA